MKVVCYATTAHGRSGNIAKAMCAGFKRHGITAKVSYRYTGVEADLAVAYGWMNKEAFHAYRSAGKHFIYVDLGFWNRRPKGNRWEGYHKVVLDDWCPLKTMRRGCSGDRFRVHEVELLHPKPGDHVLVTGMSAKSAIDHGFKAGEWETNAIASLKSVSERRIIYRPKPSWVNAMPISGAEFDRETRHIETLLKGARFLATHHSNTAVDAIVAGIPMYCAKGVGAALSTKKIADVETARCPSDDERIGLLNDIAYIQWSPEEMRTGKCWEHYRELIR